MATQPSNILGPSLSEVPASSTPSLMPTEVIVEAMTLICDKVASLKGKKEMEIWLEVQQSVWHQLVSVQ